MSIILSGSFSTKSNNNKEKDKDKEPDAIPKKEVPAYKYSAKGTSTLHEAIILQGQPSFVTWYSDYGTNNENIKIVPLIEEATRIIRPPSAEHIRLTTLPMKKS